MCCRNSLPHVRLLVEHGADVNARSKQGHTPLLVAASHAGGLEIVKLLLAKGASLKSAVRNPATPGQRPATGIPPDERFRNPPAAAADANDTALINFVLDKGGPEMTAGPAGPMALMSAAGFGNSAIVRRLLAMGVDVNAQSPPEMERVKNGPLGSAASARADPGDWRRRHRNGPAAARSRRRRERERCSRHMTPLMLAVATDHLNQDIIRMLLARRPATQVKSKAGETALDWALKFKHPSVLAALRAAAATADAPKAAAWPAAGVPHVRGAMARSVALLENSAVTSFREGGCISCTRNVRTV